MSQSSFAHSLLASTCVTGIIFSATALPFAALKSNVVNVEIQNQPIFSSELQYLAAPYLAVAGGMSVAVGVGVFGVLGWRHSARKLSTIESNKAELTKTLAVHQAELERIKFSDARLRNQNLNAFLQPETPWQKASGPIPPSSIVDVQPAMPVHSLTQPEVSHQPFTPAKPNAGSVNPSRPISVESSRYSDPEMTHEPIESLLSQLQHLSHQVEELKKHSATRLAA
jgi:hypothetical protein